MSWPNKQGSQFIIRSSLVALSLLLAGCGFRPLYGQKSNDDSSKLFAGVKIDSIPGRMGQEFKAELEDRLNPDGALPVNPTYRLNLTLTNTEAPIGVARDGTVSRYNVYLDSKYTLFRIADNKPVTTGTLRNVSSYNNITNAYFSTYVSEQDAITRGITELSEVYRQRLAAYLDAGAPQQPIPATPAATVPPPDPMQQRFNENHP